MSLSSEFIAERPRVEEGLRDPNILHAIFLAGAGGSGKSLVSDALFGGSGLKVINADTHLERFLKFADVPAAEVGLEYGLFRKARDAMRMELRHYAQRRLGLIIDSTAWDYGRIAAPARKLRELGYDLFMVFVTTTLERALARNRARGEAGGRLVPDSYVEDAWRGAHRNLNKYAKLFGPKNMHIIDNNVDVAVDDWVAVIKPKLYNLGQRILKRPLKNPIGKKWLEQQENPATRTLDKPGPSEWPKPPEPVLPPLQKRERSESIIGSAPLPLVNYSIKSAVMAAMHRAVESGPLFIRPDVGGFVTESSESDAHYYVRVVPGSAVLFEKESDGVFVPIREFRLCGTRLVVERSDILLPLALDEKHWRDDPKDFRTRLKITPEKSHPSHEVASIGKSAKDGKWYGWSHRAYSGFKKGDKFFPKLRFNPYGMTTTTGGPPSDDEWSSEKQDAWEKEQREKQPKIASDAEARQSAINFADWVS